MVIAAYRVVGRMFGSVEEAVQTRQFSLDDFEQAKRKYAELNDHFNDRAGYFENCNQILEALEYVEERICGLEEYKGKKSSILNVTVGEARNRMEEFLFSSRISRIYDALDLAESLISDLVYDDPRVQPGVKIIKEACDVDTIITDYLDSRDFEREVRRRMLEEIKKAGISIELAEFLTTNEIAQQHILF